MSDARRACLLYAGVALLFFVPAWLGGRLFFPLHTDQMQPWRTDTPAATLTDLDRRANPAVSDKNFLFHADTCAIVEAQKHAEAPLWNPWILGGCYQLGQALFGAFYPPHSLFLLIAPRYAYAVLAALHLFLTALGVWLWLRELGIAPSAACIGGLIAAISGPMVFRFHYFMTFEAAVCVPWLWWLGARYCAAPGLRRLCWLSLPVAAIFLTGFPQTGLYGIYALTACGTYRLLIRRQRRSLRAWLGLIAALLLGGGLAAIQVLPVLDVQGRSLSRERTAEHQSQQTASAWMLAGLLVPDAVADPRMPGANDVLGNPLWPAFYARRGEDGRPLLLARPNLTEDGCYLGALGLLLALAALWQRPRSLALFTLAGLLLGGAYALGVAPLVKAAFHLLPLARMGDVRRILPTLALLCALLGALGVERLQGAGAGAIRRLIAVLSAAITACVGAGFLWLDRAGAEGLRLLLEERIAARFGSLLEELLGGAATPWHADAFEHCFRATHAALGRALLVWSLATAVTLALLARRLPARSVPWILAAALAADLAWVHFRYNPFVPAQRFLEPHPFLEPLAFESLEGRIHRFASPEHGDLLREVPLPVNLGMHFGIDDAEGYIVAVPERYARYLEALQPRGVAPVLVYPLSSAAELASPLLVHASVRAILTQEDLSQVCAQAGVAPPLLLAHQHGANRCYRITDALPFATLFQEVEELGTDGRDLAALHSRILSTLAGSRTPALHVERPDRTEDRRRAWPGSSRVSHLRRWRGHLSLEVQSEAGGMLYLTQGFDPGWKAWVGGVEVPLYPANVAFTALEVPPGSSRVELAFQPRSFRRGAALSLVALLAAVAGLWIRPRPAPQESVLSR